MKIFLLSLCCIFTGVAVQAQNKSINFDHTSLAELKAKAVKEKKVIFLDCYTSWCGPCKKMMREVFTNNEVADYFNAQFINAKIDMEKGEGPQLAKLYGVKAYPTLIFIDAQGKIISKREGALEAKDFLDYGKKSVSGESLEFLKAEYDKGNRSTEFMKKYMTRMEGQRENTSALIEDYFAKTPKTQWQTKDNWYFIDRYVRSESSPVFKYVVDNKKAYEQKFTVDVVSAYFVRVYRNSISKAANSVFPIEELQDLKVSFQQLKFDGTAKLLLECDAAIADRNRDLKTYIDVMSVLYTKYPEKDPELHISLLNELCWKMLQKSSDQYVLQKATKLAEVSVQTKKPNFMDTYASLLFETGNIDKAIEVEENILSILKVKPDPDFPIADCEARLEKFKRKKS